MFAATVVYGIGRSPRNATSPFPPLRPAVRRCRVHGQKSRLCSQSPRRRDGGRVAAIRQVPPSPAWPPAHRTCSRPGHRSSGSSAASLPFLPNLVTLVQQRQALPTRHRSLIICGNPFHFGPMGSFSVARITQDHAVVVEGVEIAFSSSVPGHRSRPGSMRANSPSSGRICCGAEIRVSLNSEASPVSIRLHVTAGRKRTRRDCPFDLGHRLFTVASLNRARN